MTPSIAYSKVPVGDYEFELSKAEVMRQGDDITLIGWGSQLQILRAAADMAEDKLGVSCELIDLRYVCASNISFLKNHSSISSSSFIILFSFFVIFLSIFNSTFYTSVVTFWGRSSILEFSLC